MKRFLTKLCTVCAASALLVSTAVPAMAYGNSFLDTYSAVPNNYAGDELYDESYWFDCEEFTQVTHRSAFRGEPYVSYLRDYSTPKHTSGNDSDGPFWGVDSDADNRYMIMNPGTYWTQDHCIEDAYTFTIDVSLADAQTLQADGTFDGVGIPNVATKFAGIRMYTIGSDNTDAMDTSASVLTPGTSGLGFNFNVADDSKDELIIYVLNSDKSVAQAAFAFDNGTFNSWTTFKVTDQLDGNLNIYINGALTSKVTIDGSSVAILDASGAEKAATDDAKIYDLANFHVINANDGDINVDNVGVKYYEDSDDTEGSTGDTEEPVATETPATEAPADETEAPATEAPVETEAPATEAPADTTEGPETTDKPTDKKPTTDTKPAPGENDDATSTVVIVVVIVVVVVAAGVVAFFIYKKKKG